MDVKASSSLQVERNSARVLATFLSPSKTDTFSVNCFEYQSGRPPPVE
jgi:hypothetical protein